MTSAVHLAAAAALLAVLLSAEAPRPWSQGVPWWEGPHPPRPGWRHRFQNQMPLIQRPFDSSQFGAYNQQPFSQQLQQYPKRPSQNSRPTQQFVNLQNSNRQSQPQQQIKKQLQPAAQPAAQLPNTSHTTPKPAAAAQPPTAPRPNAQGITHQCGVTEAKRIVGGEIAKRGQIPWQVAIYYQLGGKETVECGGALVHPRFVLTAAHCFDPKTTGSYKLSRVLLGAVDLRRRDNASLELVPDGVTCHPDFRGTGPEGERNAADICLLRLPQAAPYTDFIRPVCLPPAPGDLAAQGASLQASGWGVTGSAPDAPKSPELLVAALPAVATASCSQLLGIPVSRQQVCAGGPADTCQGDSGGPLVRVAEGPAHKAFEVVGVLSYGTERCGLGKPGVFTRVDAFLPWIQSVLGSVS